MQQQGEGVIPGDPARVPWEQLPAEYQESCRRQADHIGEKLSAIACRVEPLRDWAAGQFHFTAAEIERLARMEHERWLAERRGTGWTLGPKDHQKKTHPQLVSWKDLPEEAREGNRRFVRELPRFLAQAGLQTCRQNQDRNDPET
jgi:hypothetical protein